MAQGFGRLGQGPVLVLGRAGMDIYADPPGSKAETSDTFFASLGGSSGNIAAGLARAGTPSELISCVSDDAVGRFVLNQLDRYGVGRGHVRTVGGEARTSFAVTETTQQDTQTVIYRNGAADLLIGQDQVEAVELDGAGGLIVTGTALATEPSRGATLGLMRRASAADVPVILDLDYRAYSWASAEDVAATYSAAADSARMIVGNDAEFDVMAGGDRGEALARRLAEGGKIAIYKRGELGSRTFTPGESFETGIFAVEALKPMGAGDAFMAGMVNALSAGQALDMAVRRGSAAAAMVVSRVGCAPAMPTSAELDAFIAGHPGPRAA